MIVSGGEYFFTASFRVEVSSASGPQSMGPLLPCILSKVELRTNHRHATMRVTE